jgi:HK97 gp10 family phage protein
MAQPGITLEFPDLPGLAEQFRQLPKSLASAAIGAAVKRAMKPAQDELKRQTPVGPTGNLRRGIATKAKRYPKTGSAVAIVGYRKSGGSKPPKEGAKRRNKAADQTQHQLLVEYGSDPRVTKSGANRGRMPAMHPIEQASRAAESQVKELLVSEMKLAYEKALKQLPRYMAARAKKGRA